MGNFLEMVSPPPLQPIPGFGGLFLAPGDLEGMRQLQRVGDEQAGDDSSAINDMLPLLLVLFTHFLRDDLGNPFADMVTLEDMEKVPAPTRLLKITSEMIKGDTGDEGN